MPIVSATAGRRCAVAAALALCWGSRGVAFAADGAPTTPPDPQAAEAKFRDGVDAFRAGHYDDARRDYAEAYALSPATETLLELAVSEYHAEHWVEAAAHFADYVQRPDAPGPKAAAVSDPGDGWVVRTEKHLTHLTLHMPAGAEIWVDGATPPVRPAVRPDPARPGFDLASLDVVVGPREVAIRVGGATRVHYVGALARAHQDITFETPDSPLPGPLPSVWPAHGPDHPGLTPTHDKGSHSLKWPVLAALAATAVVSGGIGGAFAIAYNRAASDADRLSPSVAPSRCLQVPAPAACGQLQQDRSEERSSGAFATGFLIGAGAAGVGAAAALLFWPSSSGSIATARLHAVPLLVTQGAGFAFDGAW